MTSANAFILIGFSSSSVLSAILISIQTKSGHRNNPWIEFSGTSILNLPGIMDHNLWLFHYNHSHIRRSDHLPASVRKAWRKIGSTHRLIFAGTKYLTSTETSKKKQRCCYLSSRFIGWQLWVLTESMIQNGTRHGLWFYPWMVTMRVTFVSRVLHVSTIILVGL